MGEKCAVTVKAGGNKACSHEITVGNLWPTASTVHKGNMMYPVCVHYPDVGILERIGMWDIGWCCVRRYSSVGTVVFPGWIEWIYHVMSGEWQPIVLVRLTSIFIPPPLSKSSLLPLLPLLPSMASTCP